MKYSVLISTIAIDSHAYTEERYTPEIKQKFLDAVMKLSVTASIDNVSELIKSQGGTIRASSITLNSDTVKIISIKSSSQENSKFRFKQVTAEFWSTLGIDSEIDPNENWCFYFVEGRTIKFYLSIDGSMNDKSIDVEYITYPTQWVNTGDSDQEMYDIYSSVFIDACRIEATQQMINLLRGEQNDLGTS